MAEKEDFEILFKEFISGGIQEETDKRYTCAVELYYKAYLKLIDWIILDERDITIDNYKQRNDEINELNGDVKEIGIPLHSIYRGTYKSKRDKKDCKAIKDGIKKLIFLKELKGSFEETAKKI